MLQQMEIAELLNDRSRQDSERSFFYAVGCGCCALLLMMFGLTMLYSTTYATAGEKLFHKQLFWAVASLAVMGGVIFLGYRRIGSLNCSFWLMLVVLVLLGIALCSHPVNGARRWIFLPGFQFQPSEMAKVVLPLYAAGVCAENLRSIADFHQWKTLLRPALLMAAVPAMVMLGHDLGTTMLLLAGLCALIVISGIQKRFFILPLLGVAVIFALVALFSPVRMARITSFTNPEAVEIREAKGYQLWTSLLALGSGSWKGIGFMESRMKQRYLPESHTDFILSIVGEELGFLGMLAVAGVYLLFGWFGMQIALHARSRFGMLLAATLTTIIVLQAGINIGVVAGGLPTKGISAPFISYGGSNLVMTMAMVALLISIGLENVPGLADRWWGRKKGE